MVQFNDNVMTIALKGEPAKSCDIRFGEGLFPEISEDVKKLYNGRRYAIITDSNVRPLYGEMLREEIGRDAEVFSFEAGEKSKNIYTCDDIIGDMTKSKYGRDTLILALGGGVVGDMAGFIAAIFNRGVPYIQIPTTLLAQADSSVGGKTAVDTKHGKNLIGAFKQPEKVYIDISTIKTLSDRDYKNGLAETIKHGIIQDDKYFEYLKNNLSDILNRDPESLLTIAKRNCEIKGNVVEKDPNEKGLRRILNYGHTIGHAIEKLSNYELSHGEAVSIGMMAAGRISNKLGYFSDSELKRQEELIRNAGLPIAIPRKIHDEDIIEATTLDKKAKGGRARYVLPISIGTMNEFGGAYATYVNNDVVIDALQRTR